MFSRIMCYIFVGCQKGVRVKICYGLLWSVLLCMVSFVWSSEPIRIEVNDVQPGNDDVLGLRMCIINNSGQQYNGIQVRYYLKKRSTDNFVLENYYLNGLSANLEQVGIMLVDAAIKASMGAI